MKIKKISIAKVIPYTISIIAAILVGTYIYFSLTAEQSHPSSTASVGYLFLPIYSIIAGILGYIVGLIPKAILNESKEKYTINIVKYSIVLIILIISTIYYSHNISQQSIQTYAELNKPKQLSNLGQYTKVFIDKKSIPYINKYAKLVWTYSDNAIDNILLNNKKYNVYVNNSTLMKIKINNEKTIAYDVSKYSYITKIYSLIYEKENKNNLTLLIRLRATSFKYILLVYDENYKLAYEELLESSTRKPYIALTQNKNLIINLNSPFILKK